MTLNKAFLLVFLYKQMVDFLFRLVALMLKNLTAYSVYRNIQLQVHWTCMSMRTCLYRIIKCLSIHILYGGPFFGVYKILEKKAYKKNLPFLILLEAKC